MATLYRKYRPQNFLEVVGQNHIKLTLEHEIQQGQLAHAYLFCGPRAVGKTTLARVVAKAINCVNRSADSAEPCNTCAVCQEITAGSAIDIIEIDAASQTGVENVRENIIAAARVLPTSLKYKVFIIDEVHMLSTHAFNALLKIMEEPPAYIVFILCTTEAHKVPNTIISRTQRFDFKKISVSEIAKKLRYIVDEEKIKIDQAILESIARYSGGHMRDAESVLGQIVSLVAPGDSAKGAEITVAEAELVIPRSNLGEVINLFEFLVKKDAAAAVRLVNNLLNDGIDLKIFINDLIETLRQVILGKINPALNSKLGLELGESLEVKATQISREASLEQLLVIINKLMIAGKEIKDSPIIQLPLELAIIEICSVAISTRPMVEPVKKIVDAPIVEKNTETENRSPSAQTDVGTAEDKIIDKPEIKITRNGLLGKEELQAKWNEFLLRLKQYNHSLSFVLRVCQPGEVVDNKLKLVFKYKFHRDRLSEPNVRALVEKVLEEVYGTLLEVEAMVDENLPIAESNVAEAMPASGIDQAKPATAQNNVIDDLLKTFGGKVVG